MILQLLVSNYEQIATFLQNFMRKNSMNGKL